MLPRKCNFILHALWKHKVLLALLYSLYITPIITFPPKTKQQKKCIINQKVYIVSHYIYDGLMNSLVLVSHARIIDTQGHVAMSLSKPWS